MKLPIKKEYFDKIKSGEKTVEFRDAHITFVCEETGRTLKKKVMTVEMNTKSYVTKTHNIPEELFEDDILLAFYIR